MSRSVLLVSDNDHQCIASVLAIGNFDGVHLGHASLLQQTVAIASSLNQAAAALTFYPHPKAILSGLTNDIYITDIRTRIQKIKQIGIQHVYIIKPNPIMLQMTPEEFIKTVLHQKIKASHIVIGANFLFGHNRTGNAQTMQNIAATYGIQTKVVPLFCLDNGTKYSSSDIREQIKCGNLEIVGQMLGDHYDIQGLVTHDQNLQAKFGVPIASININHIVKPPFGVYIAQISINNRPYNWALVNIGNKPTTIVSKNQVTTSKAYIIGFSQNIYYKYCKIRLKKFIRKEQEFSLLSKLKSQIQQDIELLHTHIANTISCPTVLVKSQETAP